MVEIHVTLVTQTPLLIGSGAPQGTLAQRGMLKDVDGWPYIPASTLKGRLRHAAEQILASIAPANVPIDPHENRIRQPDDAVSNLFGSPWKPGLAVFEDLQLVGPETLLELKTANRWPRTSERTSVSVNRRRRVAADQRLFRTEVLWPGVEFQFGGRISGDLTMAEAGLLVAGLRLVPAMGGRKSAGMGWVTARAEVTSNGDTWTRNQMLAALREEQ